MSESIVTLALRGSEERLDVGRLATAVGRLNRLMRQGGNPGGLGPGSAGALATIARLGPVRLGDLAVREGVTPSTLTRIMAVLEEADLVGRTPDPADGRAWLVRVTPAGLELITAIAVERARRLAAGVAELDPDQQEVLLRVVPVLEALTARTTIAQDAQSPDR